MTRQWRLALAFGSATWVAVVLACGGGGKRAATTQQDTDTPTARTSTADAGRSAPSRQPDGDAGAPATTAEISLQPAPAPAAQRPDPAEVEKRNAEVTRLVAEVDKAETLCGMMEAELDRIKTKGKVISSFSRPGTEWRDRKDGKTYLVYPTAKSLEEAIQKMTAAVEEARAAVVTEDEALSKARQAAREVVWPRRGAAAYDGRPEPQRSRLVREYELEVEQVRQAMAADRERLKVAKTSKDRINFRGHVARYEDRLTVLARNDPPLDREAEEERKRAAEEYDADGLVLLRKTVTAKRNQFGATITGTVVNRRGRKLAYAEIRFTLYDKTGAQVGTAIDNITDLEAGGRWNFKAISLGTDFATYKFAELSGR